MMQKQRRASAHPDFTTSASCLEALDCYVVPLSPALVELSLADKSCLPIIDYAIFLVGAVLLCACVAPLLSRT